MMQNKYKEGEVVFERVRPAQKLVINRYLEGIYYCKAYEPSTRKELVFLERDLRA